MGYGGTSTKKHEGSSGEGIDILEHWGLLESDFQREYNMDLAEKLDTITWRRFLVLFNGLSANAVIFHVINNKETKENKGAYIDQIMI